MNDPRYEHMNVGKLILYRKCKVAFVAFLLVAAFLIYRLADIQLVHFEEYQSGVIDQYTTETTLSAKRGNIYDRNMMTLAVSATVERVFVSPDTVPEMTVAEYIENKVDAISDSKKKAEKRQKLEAAFENKTITVAEDIANELSTILGVERADILTKLAKKHRKDETIQNRVELEVTDRIREVMEKKEYAKYIHFAEQTKRYYPYGTLASHLIGFTNSEETGIYGVEAYYENRLKGIPGKVLTAQNALGDDMSFKHETYVEAKDGDNLLLTVDWTVQHILEKYLQSAFEENRPDSRVCGIVMDVNNGEILGMSTKPDFDLNSPYTLDATSQEIYEAFEGTEEEKAEEKQRLLYGLWKDKNVAEIYEPGSTFKIITAAMCLEEGVVKTSDQFYCPGSVVVPYTDQRINCHKLEGHGSETFEEGLWNSCNPVFVTVSSRLGRDLFYKYYEAFGYAARSGIDVTGEATNYFFPNFSIMDLAVSSFGQNFKVTPVSHLSAVCAAVNGGYLVTPHVLKGVVDDDGNLLESYDTTARCQVISSQTSETLRNYLRGGVEYGGAKNAYVQGYTVGAKTGTSVKTEIKAQTGETFYIASTVAFAPVENPQVAVLVVVDGLTVNQSFYGGTVAAPIASDILTEVLPYLGVEAQYSDDDVDAIGHSLPNLRGYNVDDAGVKLKDLGYTFRIVGTGYNVRAQVPAAGDYLATGGQVVLYTDTTEPEATVTVPSVIGLSASSAAELLANNGLNIEIVDSTMTQAAGAQAVSQSPGEGALVPRGTVVAVTFRHEEGW
ncbi:MAG: PASTA domain-containing protein [Clostridia bacterium]|nr:PASTA domain-containing protein [Clostridia bacterium]